MYYEYIGWWDFVFTEGPWNVNTCPISLYTDPSRSFNTASRTQCIERAGTGEQKEHYLPLMSSGKCIGAFCLSENIR